MPTRVHRPAVSPLSREVVDRWAEVPASVAADLFQGVTLIDPAIRPLRPIAGGRHLVGTAVTALAPARIMAPCIMRSPWPSRGT